MAMVRKDGIQTQIISLFNTRQPHSLKKLVIPIGETVIGRNGKKKRVLSNGAKKATPNPPVVIASRIGWEAVHKKKNANKPTHRLLNLFSSL